MHYSMQWLDQRHGMRGLRQQLCQLCLLSAVFLLSSSTVVTTARTGPTWTERHAMADL